MLTDRASGFFEGESTEEPCLSLVFTSASKRSQCLMDTLPGGPIQLLRTHVCDSGREKRWEDVDPNTAFPLKQNPSFRQRFGRAINGNRENGKMGFERQVKCSVLKRAQLPVRGAGSFGKDHHRTPSLQCLFTFPHHLQVPPDGSTVEADIPVQCHVPADQRYAEVLGLGHPFVVEAKTEQDKNIGERLVICDDDMRSGGGRDIPSLQW
jgi:hypothetical protein